jgi:threonine aldolase
VPDIKDRYREAADHCDSTVFWHRRRSPGEVLRSLADACDELDLDWDVYAERGPVARLEAELAELLGTEGAAFFPSGTMAQQAALRAWCDRAGTRRVAMPDIAHPLVHEQDGPRRLHGFEVEHLTVGPRVATADDLAAVPGRLGAVLVELPLRDAGCAHPSWGELTARSAAARERGVAQHADGARIWEAQPYWDRPFPEVVALFDSIYVSFYKGLGGLAGAALAGPTDFQAEARMWRARMGGTIYHLTPEAVAGLVGLRDLLPRMPECLAWARSLAAEVSAAGITPNPTEPHTPTFLLHASGDADEVNERVVAFLERERLNICGLWRSGLEPGRITTEVMVSVAALEHDPAKVAGRLAELVAG